jgi:hypothetical protein
VTFHVEFDPDAWTAYDTLPDGERDVVAEAIMRLLRHGIPDEALPAEKGQWRLPAAHQVIYFLEHEHEHDIYVWAILPNLQG